MKNPYAKTLMSINGAADVTGGQTVPGSATIQLHGESTIGWTSQLWEIYEYPTGFACPAGWTNSQGIYQCSSVTPPSFAVASNATWGKYFFRLTVNQGLLNGVYAGTDSTQPLVDESCAVSVLSSNNVNDIGFGEKNQFDATRGQTGELKKAIRALNGGVGVGGGWVTAANISFAGVADPGLTANGTYTLAGVAGVKRENAANDRVAMAVNAQGVIMSPATGSAYNPTAAQRTAPLLWFPFSSLGLPSNIDFTTSIRVLASVAVSAQSAFDNGHGLYIGIDSNDGAYSQYVALDSNTFSVRSLLAGVWGGASGSAGGSVGGGALNTTPYVLMGEFETILSPRMQALNLIRDGVAAWPDLSTMAPMNSVEAAAGNVSTFNPSNLTLLNRLGVVVAARAAQSVDAYQVTVSNLRVDYRL